MAKNATKIIFILLTLALTISTASAYNTFQLSEKWSYNEDIKGEDRGFTLKHSLDIPRNYGIDYYDWRYRPEKPTYYALRDINSFNDKETNSAALSAAFKTFQQDSKDQTDLQKIEALKPRYYKYGSYRGYYRYSHPTYSVYKYSF